MNPLKLLLDSFDRLINERGSSTILRERLALAADQYAAIEKKLDDLKKENKRLKTDNENLKKKIGKLDQNDGFACGANLR